MERVKGLTEYVKSKEYRVKLNLDFSQTEEYIFLAQGEYNINYFFIHPLTKQKLVLRVNCGSQMNLDYQIEYEYSALKLLEESGRTPRVYYVDGSKKKLDYGILVMEFLEGKSLDYTTDLLIAAEILADIHSLDIMQKEKKLPHRLIRFNNSLKAIFDECCLMIKIYNESSLSDPDKKKIIQEMFVKAERLINTNVKTMHHNCCINTELNSSNFLINGKGKSNYLIDWEKPLFGDPVQDLAHFLAPTTTFWKTDIILNMKDINLFLNKYIEAVSNRFKVGNIQDRLNEFISVTCLRGITWCAMAWVQYQHDDKKIKNEYTWKKLNQYLDLDCLNNIYNNYFNI